VSFEDWPLHLLSDSFHRCERVNSETNVHDFACLRAAARVRLQIVGRLRTQDSPLLASWSPVGRRHVPSSSGGTRQAAFIVNELRTGAADSAFEHGRVRCRLPPGIRAPGTLAPTARCSVSQSARRMGGLRTGVAGPCDVRRLRYAPARAGFRHLLLHIPSSALPGGGALFHLGIGCASLTEIRTNRRPDCGPSGRSRTRSIKPRSISRCHARLKLDCQAGEVRLRLRWEMPP
jgi:hypothetical protein